MWLDRLGHANPPTSGFDSRPISPLPRRVSGRGSPYVTSQQRSARASTASLVSSSSNAGSTTSLLRSSSYRANGALPGGSSLRQSHTVDDGTQSLAVLGRILGAEVLSPPPPPVEVSTTSSGSGSGSASPSPSTLPSPAQEGKASTITEEDIDADFDFGGLSLREFVARGNVRDDGAGVHRPQTVEECMWIFLFLFYFILLCSFSPLRPFPLSVCLNLQLFL